MASSVGGALRFPEEVARGQISKALRWNFGALFLMLDSNPRYPYIPLVIARGRAPMDVLDHTNGCPSSCKWISFIMQMAIGDGDVRGSVVPLSVQVAFSDRAGRD